MRRIALFVSVLLLSLSCAKDDAEPQSGGDISIAYLRSLAKERTVKLKYDYTIRGHVVANDKYDEVTSCFVVADATGGVEIDVDMRDVDIYVPLFSTVTVHCSGLALGRVGGKICLGESSADEYVVGRIAEAEVYNRVKVDTTDNTPISAQRLRIAELTAHDMLKYICIDSLRTIEEGVLWADVDPATGDYVTTIRHFTDGRDTLRVVVNGRCHYASQALPVVLVSLRGVLDWHDGDIAFRVSNRGITYR